MLLQIEARIITKQGNFAVLQSRTCVTLNWGSLLYYRVRHKVLQSGATFITNQDNYYKVGKHTFQGIPVAL